MTSSALPARRAREVRRGALHGVVVEVDATEHPRALAVLQAGLHELPEGARLVHGYDVRAVGLGEWVGDRRVRIAIWPALLRPDGSIDADDPSHPDSDLLEIDLDPATQADALRALLRIGRLVVAGPEGGPVPMIVDLDRDLLARVLDEVGLEAG